MIDFLYALIYPVLVLTGNYFLVKFLTKRYLYKTVEDAAEAHVLWSSYGSSYDEAIQKVIEDRICTQGLEARALNQVNRKLEKKLDLDQYDLDRLRAIAQEVVCIINQNQLRKPNE